TFSTDSLRSIRSRTVDSTTTRLSISRAPSSATTSLDCTTVSERCARLVQRLARLLEGGVLRAALAALGLPSTTAAAALTGAAHLEVDAREAPRVILKVHLTHPVRPGLLTLVYPKWLPGRHGPAGPITDLAGPVLHSGSERIAWRRDDLDMYAFHLEVPSGVSTLDADF